MSKGVRCVIAVSLFGALAVAAWGNDAIPLWPKGVPGGKSASEPERDMTTAQDNLVAGKPVIRLGNVSGPTLTFYAAAAASNSGATVIVFPGGGYRILALDLEGTEVCTWLNSIGVNAVLVKYRVPSQPGVPRYAAPLQDAQRAIGMVRNMSTEWHVDADRIGVLGFSAGGHLAALASNECRQRTYDAVDAADKLSACPNFTILIYPAYIATGEQLNDLAPEFHITSSAPPAILVQTEDDSVHVENSLVYYRALKNAKVPAEMHLFSTGGHGYGMRPDSTKPVTGWPKLVEAWLRSSKFMK